jgi:hypothetical protein
MSTISQQTKRITTLAKSRDSAQGADESQRPDFAGYRPVALLHER